MLSDFRDPKHDAEAKPEAMFKTDSSGSVQVNHISVKVDRLQDETNLPPLALGLQKRLQSTGSLKTLKIRCIECRASTLEKFLDTVLDLVNPDDGLKKLEFGQVTIYGGSLSDAILTKLVSLCKKHEELTIDLFCEIDEAPRQFFFELVL